MFLRLTIKNENPITISTTPKNATLSLGKMPNSIEKVKTNIAIPRTIIIELLIEAVECKSKFFFAFRRHKIITLFFFNLHSLDICSNRLRHHESSRTAAIRFANIRKHATTNNFRCDKILSQTAVHLYQ